MIVAIARRARPSAAARGKSIVVFVEARHARIARLSAGNASESEQHDARAKHRRASP